MAGGSFGTTPAHVSVPFAGTVGYMRTTPTIHIICGFIGAGKPTFARRLEAETGAVRITKDAWLIRLIGHDPAIEGYAELDRRVCALSRELAFDLASKGIDVILDEGFWSRQERADLKQRVRDVGAEPVVYFVDTPIDVIRERVAHRNEHLTEDAFVISSEMLEGYLPFWEPPAADEDCVIVRDSISTT